MNTLLAIVDRRWRAWATHWLLVSLRRPAKFIGRSWSKSKQGGLTAKCRNGCRVFVPELSTGLATLMWINQDLSHIDLVSNETSRRNFWWR